MKPFSRLTRLAAAGALVVSAAAVWSAAPAGATNTNATQNCLSSSTQYFSIANSDTVTITITAGDCARVTFDPNGTSATATLNSAPLATSPVFVNTNDVIVLTAPASGAGQVFFRFDDVSADVPVIRVSFGRPVTGSIAAPGNGTLVVTYSGAVNTLSGVVVYFTTPGSVCNGTNPPTELQPMDNPPDNYQYVIDSSQFGSEPTLGASPSTISAGTMVMSNQGPGGVAIPAGTYQACLFGYNYGLTLLQSLEVTLGTVTPTTTTPSTPVTPTITG